MALGIRAFEADLMRMPFQQVVVEKRNTVDDMIRALQAAAGGSARVPGLVKAIDRCNELVQILNARRKKTIDEVLGTTDASNKAWEESVQEGMLTLDLQNVYD